MTGSVTSTESRRLRHRVVGRAAAILTATSATFMLLGAPAGARTDDDGGRVVAWGRGDFGETNVPKGLKNVIAVAAGSYHALALKSDGTVVAWGAAKLRGHEYFDWGQADVPAGLRDVVAIEAGPMFSAAVRRDGSVEVWPKSALCGAQPPANLGHVVSVAAGGAHLVALRADGTVTAWGHSEAGELNAPPALVGVRAIAASYSRNWALQENGTVVGWGEDHKSGYKGLREMVVSCDSSLFYETHTARDDVIRNLTSDTVLGSDVDFIAAGRNVLLLGDMDGMLKASAHEECPLSPPAGLGEVASAAVGGGASPPHAVALVADGTVVSWNCKGKQRKVPEGLRNVKQVAAGERFDLALIED